MTSSRKYKCPCCGKFTLPERDEYEICPVCHWEDDKSQRKAPDLRGGANKLSLNEARAKYLEHLKDLEKIGAGSSKTAKKADSKTLKKSTKKSSDDSADGPKRKSLKAAKSLSKDDTESEKTKILHDKDIRDPLCIFLETTFGKSRIFEEKMMGNSRADMVMVLPYGLCGIEIKSDADTYVRLSRQVKDYSAYYDFNYVVAGGSHGNHIAEHVPDDWGIITVDNVDGKPDFYFLRPAKHNPNMRRDLKLSILWRPELAHIQEINNLKPYKTKSKDFVRKYILDSVDGLTLDKQICEELFERDYDTIAERLNAYRQAHGQRKRRRRRKYRKP